MISGRGEGVVVVVVVGGEMVVEDILGVNGIGGKVVVQVRW